MVLVFHSDIEGKIALYGRNTAEYDSFVKNPKLKKVKAMRSSSEQS